MNKETLYAAIKNVAGDLCALSEEEFARELETHQDGDITKILLETKALDVGEIEAELFDHYSIPYAEAWQIDLSRLRRDSNLTYGSGHIALQGILSSSVTDPISSFAALNADWSSEVTSVKLQVPVRMTSFAQRLPGHEMTRAEPYNIGKKIFAESQESIAADKVYSLNDEQGYKLAA